MSNKVPVSNWCTINNWAVHLMQCLYYSQSGIGTLVASKDGQRLIAFFEDEFDFDMISDPSIPTTQHESTVNAVFIQGLENLKL